MYEVPLQGINFLKVRASLRPFDDEKFSIPDRYLLASLPEPHHVETISTTTASQPEAQHVETNSLDSASWPAPQPEETDSDLRPDVQQYGQVQLNTTSPQMEVWEKFVDPNTARAWYWHGPTEEYFFKDSAAQHGWQQFRALDGRLWWCNVIEQAQRSFFEPGPYIWFA